MIKFDHVAIVVKNLEKVIKFYIEIFECKKLEIFEVNEPGFKIRYAMLYLGNNCWIEFIEPKQGPWVKRLKEKGEGVISELCLRVNSIIEFYDKLKNKGIIPVDRYGKPLTDKKYVISASGNKFIYLPTNKTFGTLIEILERRECHQLDGKP